MNVIPLIGADMQSVFFDWNSKLSSYAPKGIKGLCIAIIIGEKVILVDTGIGLHYIDQPRTLNWKYRIALGKRLNKENSVLFQLNELGYSANQVSQIILTHLHVDHSAGLKDFPNAKITVYHKEYEAANAQKNWNEKITYYKKNWNHNPNWDLVMMDGTTFGFESGLVFEENGLRIFLLSLPGHCKGHCGVYIEHGSYKLFHCADAFLSKRSLTDPSFEFPWHFRIFRNFIIHSEKARKHTIHKLRGLLKSGPLLPEEFTCSHDEADIIKQQRRAKNYFN